jgi:hypothetical protein
VRRLLRTHADGARHAALRAHWPQADAALEPLPGQRLSVGSTCTLRVLGGAVPGVAYLLEPDGIAVGSIELPTGEPGIEWLAPARGFMRRWGGG